MFPQQAGQAKYMKKTQEPTRSPAGAHAKTVVKTTEPSRSPPRSHTLRGKTQGTHTIHPLGNIMPFDKMGGQGPWRTKEYCMPQAEHHKTAAEGLFPTHGGVS